MDGLNSEWQCKGATLSHKTAEKEFGLTWEEIVRAIRAGKLQYREHSIYGTPWLRLLRREVEALVGEDVAGDSQREEAKEDDRDEVAQMLLDRATHGFPPDRSTESPAPAFDAGPLRFGFGFL